MAHEEEDKSSGQMSTNHVMEKKAAGSAPSTSSEDIDEEDDFFQIEGPSLGTKFSLNVANQSPPVQAMSRGAASDECPDPKRIPSSVFARSKSNTPMEWSVTSNESLFSINIGNASFSQDHHFLYGKSGEMGDPNQPLAPLPPLPRRSLRSSSVKREVASEPAAAAQTSAVVKPAAAPTEEQREGDGDIDSTNSLPPRRSNIGSTTSFAFPILAGDARSSELDRQTTAQLKVEQSYDEKDRTPKAAIEAQTAEEPAPPLAPPPPATKSSPWCSCCGFCC